MKFQILLILIYANQAFAGNPVIKDIGMSDPHVRVFNDTLYLFTGHDQTPQDKLWDMRYWQVFSSTNLVDWKPATTISPKDNYMNNTSKDCWAGDASTRNGKFYFYFSDRNRSVGVMESAKANGVYKDALGHALAEPGHDPTVFVDNDATQTPYLIYGSNEIGGFHIAKLNDDMVSVAETAKLITITGDEWSNAPTWQDKNYIFKHNDTYYLSWGRDYATSKNIYGPYESAGLVGSGYKLSEFAHGSFFMWKGQFYHIWCYYLENGLKYRESIITYCHFDNNGKIVTDTRFLDQHFDTGVGQYKADWDKIEAEWFYEKSENVEKKQNKEGDFVLSGITNNSWIRFNKVQFMHNSKFTTQLNFEGQNGNIEIRSGGINGTLLGDIAVTEGLQQVLNKELSEINGEHNIFLVFKGDNANFELDWFSFGGNEYASIPGKIEAENYVNMFGFQTEKTTDTGGGENVGWVAVGDWLEYNIDVDDAGVYQFDFRVAALENNIKFKLLSDTSLLVNVDEPFTGGWQTWKTYTSEVKLKAGKQKLKLIATGERWNLNWLNFSNNPLFTNSIQTNLEYTIYPNPCTTSLNIESKELCAYKLYNAAGSLVALSKNDANKFNISTSKLPNGIYLLQVNQKGYNAISKISIL